MKVWVDPDLCISCGLCINTCPEVYEWDNGGKAVAKDDGAVPAGSQGAAKEAVEGCPVNAIKEE